LVALPIAEQLLSTNRKNRMLRGRHGRWRWAILVRITYDRKLRSERAWLSSSVATCAYSFLAGVGCIGKTTVGAKLADLLEYRFFDLDVEIEHFFGTSIERLRNRYLTSFRVAASQALKHVLSQEDSCNCVIALPPSGLMGAYWKVVNKTLDATIVVLRDAPEHVLERITFYDVDSRPTQRILTDREKSHYLREIRKYITYFGHSFKKAHVSIDITNCSPDEVSRKVKDKLMLTRSREQCRASEQPLGSMR
jgi:shikimate kinase